VREKYRYVWKHCSREQCRVGALTSPAPAGQPAERALSFFTWKRISCLLLYLFDLFCQKLTSLFCFPSSFWQDHSKITDAQRGELSPKAYICTLLLLVHCTLINYCVLLLDLQVTGEPVGEVRAVSGMHERKAEMARFADAFVALPGIYILVYPILFSS